MPARAVTPTMNRMVPAANNKPRNRNRIFIANVSPHPNRRAHRIGPGSATRRTPNPPELDRARPSPAYAAFVVAPFLVPTEAAGAFRPSYFALVRAPAMRVAK